MGIFTWGAALMSGVLVGLRLAGFVDWPWAVVLFPVLLEGALVGLLLFGSIVAVCIGEMRGGR